MLKVGLLLPEEGKKENTKLTAVELQIKMKPPNIFVSHNAEGFGRVTETLNIFHLSSRL